MTSSGARAAALFPSPDRLILTGLFVALAITPVVFVPQLYDDFTLPKQVSLLIAAALVLTGLVIQGFPVCAPRPLRLAISAWLAALMLSELLAIDPRGSALGLYQYRQGLLTQLSYVVLLLGALRIAAVGKTNFLWNFILIGMSGATLYTIVQALALDPVHWWVDTSDRAIGTIGNANELAAYAIVSLVAIGQFARRGGRSRLVVLLASAAVTFVILESESRSGLASFVLYLLLMPLAWWVARSPWRDLLRPGALVLGGAVAGVALSLLSGSLAGTAARVEGGVATADAGGSTRFALWQGAVEVVRSSPLYGVGPDGLYLAFPVHRPERLSGAFLTYDLVAQSSHNLVLDVAANYGVFGLAAFLAVIALAAWYSVRTRRHRDHPAGDVGLPWVWSALAAYGAITLVNPASLAPQAAFFVVLGAIAGVPIAQAGHRAISPAIRWIAVSPLLLAVVFLAIRISLADVRANQAWMASADGDFATAARRYHDATRIMPIERNYAASLPRALLAEGVRGPKSALVEADAAFSDLDRQFGFNSSDAIGQATARLGLARDPSLVNPLIDRAVSLNPYGVFIDSYANTLRLAVVQGAVLHYSLRDRWVFVEPVPPPGSTSADP